MMNEDVKPTEEAGTITFHNDQSRVQLRDLVAVFRVVETVNERSQGINVLDKRIAVKIDTSPVRIIRVKNTEVYLESISGVTEPQTDLDSWAVNSVIAQLHDEIAGLKQRIGVLKRDAVRQEKEWDGLLDMTLGEIVDRFTEGD